MNVFLPPNSVALHATPMDMESKAAIGRMYGDYNVRPGWMYPRGPYGGGAGGGMGAVPVSLRGLGFDYWDLLRASGMENCEARDFECVARNQQRDAAVEDLWVNEYISNPDTANQPTPTLTIGVDRTPAATQAFLNNQTVTTATIRAGSGPVYTDRALEAMYSGSRSRLPGAGGGGAYSPKVTFSTSTGDTSQLLPGNTWAIQITGAEPGSAVSVRGGQNGATDTAQMGNADGNGNWKATGTIDTSQIGTWTEQWTAGGVNAGSFSFTVRAANQNQQALATGKPNASVPPSDNSVPFGGGDGVSGGGTGVLFGMSSQETMLLAVAALAAVVLLKGK